MKKQSLLAVIALALVSVTAQAGEEPAKWSDAEPVASVAIHRLTEMGTGESLGIIVVKESEHGLIFDPALSGLSPGIHGFHLHENASCEPSVTDGDPSPGGEAGGHYDPKHRKNHDAPWSEGHLGDLPVLYVDQDGTATRAVLSPRLAVDDLAGSALIIHAEEDDYSTDPSGSSGARIACGVFGD